MSYVASYVGPIQTGFLRGFQKSSCETGIVAVRALAGNVAVLDVIRSWF